MLQVKVIRTVTQPEYQRFVSIVTVHGFDRLTPRAAQAALEIAYGQTYGGEVWCPDGFGYRVYKNSARKLRAHHFVVDWPAQKGTCRICGANAATDGDTLCERCIDAEWERKIAEDERHYENSADFDPGVI